MNKFNLEEAAEKYGCNTFINDCMENGVCDSNDLSDAFKAGAEWQKEQDQPITGNSLEQEWLRYVDRKKKECGGELPALGEYGWLQIARHFAEWQKKQIPMPEDTVIFNKGVAEGKRLMLEGAIEGEVYKYDKFSYVKEKNSKSLTELLTKFNDGDTVKIIIMKED